jgi:hypothetical protein
MEYTIGFFDTFDHLTARATVQAETEIQAISLAAENCNVSLSRVGRIELESADREWLARLDSETRVTPSWIERTDE